MISLRTRSWMRVLGVGLVVAGAFASGCKRSSTPADGVSSLQQSFPDPSAVPEVQLAIGAVQTNDLAQGVVALEAAKLRPGLTAEQLQSVEETKQALTRELLDRAEAGDARAKAELEMIERTRSQ